MTWVSSGTKCEVNGSTGKLQPKAPKREIPKGRKCSWVPQISPESYPILASLRSWAADHVYYALASRADRYTGECFAARRHLAQEIGASERTVTTAFQKLARVGLITRLKFGDGKKANEFKVFGLVPAKKAKGAQNESQKS